MIPLYGRTTRDEAERNGDEVERNGDKVERAGDKVARFSVAQRMSG
jgi:hypothetical protein